MAQDIAHWFGNDLSVSPTGDLLLVGDLEKGRQRILRRLLTPTESYIWHTDYGAGLPSYIGELRDDDLLEAVIRYQIAHEAQVAPLPPPDVTTTPIFAGVQSRIVYTDADSGNPTSLGFDLTE